MLKLIRLCLYILSLAALTIVAVRVWYFYRSPHSTPITVSQTPAAENIHEPITPLPLADNVDQAKVSLGEQLFHDPLLSRDNTISCSSCHSLATGGTDQLVHSIGLGGRKAAVNSPSVFNSGLNFVQFWDGRAETLEDQIDGPLTNPDEMGSNWDEVLLKLRQLSLSVHLCRWNSGGKRSQCDCDV